MLVHRLTEVGVQQTAGDRCTKSRFPPAHQTVFLFGINLLRLSMHTVQTTKLTHVLGSLFDLTKSGCNVVT